MLLVVLPLVLVYEWLFSCLLFYPKKLSWLYLVPSQLQAFPGVNELVRRCRLAGLLAAVASSADRIKVVANLQKIGLPAESWDAVVTGELVEHKKPAPDIFLIAALRLGVSPAECAIVEDAVNGIQAAKAAGMRCIAVAQTFPAEQLQEADIVRNRIADVQLSDLAPGFIGGDAHE
jgi:HAD superfamily hydrolase (TIGR01509 family)